MTNSIFKTIKNDFFSFPLYVLSHPFTGFDELKSEKKGKYSVAVTILALLCFLNIIEFLYLGFPINNNNPNKINSMFIIATTILPYALFITANWSTTTLIDGNGRYSEIFMVVMYSLYPTIWLRALGILLSNFLSLDEMPLAYFFFGFSTVLFCFYLFIGLVVVHEFTFTRTVLSILFTVIAMFIILFIMILLVSLVNEFLSFIRIIINEVKLKM